MHGSMLLKLDLKKKKFIILISKTFYIKYKTQKNIDTQHILSQNSIRNKARSTLDSKKRMFFLGKSILPLIIA